MELGLIWGHFTLTSCSYSISRWVTDICGGAGEEKLDKKGKVHWPGHYFVHDVTHLERFLLILDLCLFPSAIYNFFIRQIVDLARVQSKNIALSQQWFAYLQARAFQFPLFEWWREDTTIRRCGEVFHLHPTGAERTSSLAVSCDLCGVFSSSFLVETQAMWGGLCCNSFFDVSFVWPGPQATKLHG